MKDFHGALLDLDLAIKQDSSDSDYYNNRGLIKIAIEDYEGGCNDFKKAYKLGNFSIEPIIKLYCN